MASIHGGIQEKEGSARLRSLRGTYAKLPRKTEKPHREGEAFLFSYLSSGYQAWRIKLPKKMGVLGAWAGQGKELVGTVTDVRIDSFWGKGHVTGFSGG